MDILTFGPISLRAGRAAVTTLTVSGAAASSTSEVLGRKAATQFKGPGLVKVDLTLRLHRELLGEDVLEAARDLVEDLKLAAEEAAGGTP